MTRTNLISSAVRKPVSAWVALVMLSMVGLTLPAHAQMILQRDISQPPETSSCPAEAVPEDGFVDVPATSVHEHAIDCIFWYEVAAGTSATTYNPGGAVRRDHMASFIARLIDYAAEPTNAGTNGPGQALPSAPANNEFTCDVTIANVHYDNIQRLAAANIVTGTHVNGEGQFCFDPGASVTRAQMAAFLSRARQYVTRIVIDLSGDADYFVDEDTDDHRNDINVMAALGIAQGTGVDEGGGRLYSPGVDVQRDQMGTFLARLLDYLVDEEELILTPR